MSALPVFAPSLAAPDRAMAAAHALSTLPSKLESAVWLGDQLGTAVTKTVPTGWDGLDRELTGGGWPCHSLTEILCPQPSTLEWRLFSGALRHIAASGGQIALIGPPKDPHLPGLLHQGIDQKHLIWIKAAAPAERLWVTEQLIKSNSAGAVIAWLPQARQEQIRRLQVCAMACEGLVFLCRPESAEHDASSAPLRIKARFGLDWELHLELLKRRGPAFDGSLVLPSVPGGLEAVLTPRLARPSALISSVESFDVVGRPAPQHVAADEPALH